MSQWQWKKTRREKGRSKQRVKGGGPGGTSQPPPYTQTVTSTLGPSTRPSHSNPPSSTQVPLGT